MKTSKDFIELDRGNIIPTKPIKTNTVAITIDSREQIDDNVIMTIKRTLLEIADKYPHYTIIVSTNNTMQLIH